MPGPRVSVITIFLDEELFLGEAIASVRAQTVDDWELILVDDGSRDRSTRIALDAAAGDRRIRYVEHPGHENRGMSASRNRGVREATAPIIAFLDADDVWLPDKLSQQTGILAAHPEVDMVYGRTLIWHAWNPGDTRADFHYELGVEPDSVYEPPQLFPVLLANRAQTPTTTNAMIRKSLVERVGGFEEAFRAMFEDQVFFAKAHLSAACYVDNRTWALYRQHPSSATARSAEARADLEARARFLNWVEEYVRSRGTSDRVVMRALRRAQRDLKVQRARSWLRSLVGGR